MRILFWGLSIFGLAFFSHIVIWKISLPKRQMKILLHLFFSILITSIFCLSFLSLVFSNFHNYAPRGFVEYIHIVIFFVTISLVYITTYSAIEADSPSLVMVMKIAESGSGGLNKDKLFELMTDDILIKPRLRDLINAGMVCVHDNTYKITRKGILFVYIFIFYRKILNLSKGG